jgi:hypothetical protein
VTINLQAGTGTGGDAQGDTLFNIDNLIGSNQNDTFYASSNANKLMGRAVRIRSTIRSPPAAMAPPA